MDEQLELLGDLQVEKEELLKGLYTSSLAELDEQLRRWITKISLIEWDLDSDDLDLYESILKDIEDRLTVLKIEISNLRINLEIVDYKLDNF